MATIGMLKGSFFILKVYERLSFMAKTNIVKGKA